MPECEMAVRDISDDIFLALTVKAERLEHEALDMDIWFAGLGRYHTSMTKPEGSIRRVAGRLQAIADSLNDMADKAAGVRQDIYLEAAE